MSRSNLSISLWGEAIKTANYILNSVPSKSIPITRRAEVKIYNPAESKLDPKTIGI